MFVGIAGAAVGPQQDVGLDLLAAFERQDDAVGLALDRSYFLVVADQRALLAQVVAERVGDFVVEELEQLRAAC
jgi:hypothetical protein